MQIYALIGFIVPIFSMGGPRWNDYTNYLTSD